MTGGFMINENKEIDIKYSSIIPLWRSAETYRKLGEGFAFEESYLMDSFSAEEATSIAITNKLLAIELYLKFIYIVDYWCINFDKSKSRVYDTNNIRELYSALSPKRKDYISELLMSDYRASNTIEAFLLSYDEEYYRWSYSFSRKTKSHTKNKMLGIILSVLRKCCVHTIFEYKYIIPQNLLQTIKSRK